MAVESILKEFAPDVFVAEGPVVSFVGFPYPTRCVIIRIHEDGHEEASTSAWVWSPIALTDDLAKAVEESIGPVHYLVSPNKIHHIFLKEWADRYPEAIIYLPPGLRERKVLTDKFSSTDGMVDIAWKEGGNKNESPSWGADIDYVIFRGSFAMEEVVFFHQASKVVIFCDLIQRHTPETNPELETSSSWKKTLMRLDGVYGPQGSTPREWRASFWARTETRLARDKVLNDWHPDGLLVAHGECVKSGAIDVVRAALQWI